jgi:hypothetical protein
VAPTGRRRASGWRESIPYSGNGSSRDGQRLPAAALQPILSAGYPACWWDVLFTTDHLDNGDCQDECGQATGHCAHLSISHIMYGHSMKQTPPWHSGMISTPTSSSSSTSSAGSGLYPMMANAPFGCPSISGAGAGDFSLTYAVRSSTCPSVLRSRNAWYPTRTATAS